MVKKYSLDHDKVAEILKDLQKYYTELSSESENAKYADMIYTDEEIEAIASGDVEKCFNLFTYNTAILKNDLNTHLHIYTTTPWINLRSGHNRRRNCRKNRNIRQLLTH